MYARTNEHPFRDSVYRGIKAPSLGDTQSPATSWFHLNVSQIPRAGACPLLVPPSIAPWILTCSTLAHQEGGEWKGLCYNDCRSFSELALWTKSSGERAAPTTAGWLGCKHLEVKGWAVAGPTHKYILSWAFHLNSHLLPTSMCGLTELLVSPFGMFEQTPTSY